MCAAAIDEHDGVLVGKKLCVGNINTESGDRRHEREGGGVRAIDEVAQILVSGSACGGVAAAEGELAAGLLAVGDTARRGAENHARGDSGFKGVFNQN